jgi:hypothetical protein
MVISILRYLSGATTGWEDERETVQRFEPYLQIFHYRSSITDECAADPQVIFDVNEQRGW